MSLTAPIEDKPVRRNWWRRHNALQIRNGRLVMLVVASLVAGAAVTLLTAYMGIR
jgi:hypothetical protein